MVTGAAYAATHHHSATIVSALEGVNAGGLLLRPSRGCTLRLLRGDGCERADGYSFVTLLLQSCAKVC